MDDTESIRSRSVKLIPLRDIVADMEKEAVNTVSENGSMQICVGGRNLSLECANDWKEKLRKLKMPGGTVPVLRQTPHTMRKLAHLRKTLDRINLRSRTPVQLP